jgi:uncharacterized membrane protein YadS
LWIAPIALMFAFLYRKADGSSKAKVAVPWFIFLFIGAAAFRTYAPSFILPSIFDSLVNLAKAGMTITLFLIGASLTPVTLKKVGIRPLVQGILLWIVISAVALWAVMKLV